MKHLKKILVAFVLVAMIASSVIVVALAEDYTGTVAEAKAFYEIYESAEALGDYSLEDVKADALADLYLYLKTSPIDPTSEGYSDLIASYNSAVTKVGYGYVYNALFATEADEKADIMKNAYLAFASSPLFNVTDYEIPIAYKCANEAHTEPTVVFFDTTAEVYAGIPADAVCPDGCEAGDAQIVAAQTLKYSEIYKETQKLNVAVSDLVANKLFEAVADAEKQANYLDLLASRQALANFLVSYSDLSVSLPDIPAYTGSLAAAEAKLSALNENGTFEEIKTGLVEIYNYLIKNPVNPAAENYASFNRDYNALCDKMMELFKAKVNAAETTEAKILIFNDMYKFLAGSEDDPLTADVNEYVAPQFISERVVNTYNTMRSEIIGAYDDMIAGIGSAEEFTAAVPGIDYNVSDISSFRSNLDRVLKMIPPVNANPVFRTVESNFKLRVYRYLDAATTNKIDPTIGGYAEAVADYKLICDYMISHHVDLVINAPKLEEKYTNLMTFRTFVSDYNVSNYAVESYNAARQHVIDSYETFYNNLSLDGLMPTFTPDEPVKTNVKIETLNSLLSDITDARGAYTAAAIEDKPAAFEAWKATVVSMYTFLSGVSINPDEAFLAEFTANYDSECIEFFGALAGGYDSAEPDAKAAELAKIKAFMEKYPISVQLVGNYNEMVEEVFAGDDDKIASESLASVYFIASDAMERINNDSTEDFLADARLLQECRNEIVKANGVWDAIYAQFFIYYNETAIKIKDTINSETETAINGGDVSVTVETITKYANFLSETNYEEAISQFNLTVNRAVNGTADKLKYLENKEGFVNDEGVLVVEVAYVTYAFEIMEGKFAAYYAATSYADKMAAFKEVKSSIENMQINVYMMDTAYVTLMAKYKEIGDDFAALMLGTLEGHTDFTTEYAALTEIKAFLDSDHYNASIAEAYNAKLAALKEQNLVAITESLKNGTYTVTYSSPENTVADFSDLGEITVGGEFNAEEYVKYFNKFSGEQRIDTLSVGFTSVIEKYSDATSFYIDDVKADYLEIKNNEELSATAKAEEQTKLLEKIKSDIGTITAPADVAQIFSTIKSEVAYNYKTTIKSTFLKYKTLVAEIHEYLVNCPVDQSVLDRDTAALYEAVMTKVEGAEYAEATAYIFDFDNATGNIPTITQNQAYNKVQQYIEKYGLDTNYSDQKLADAVLSDMFAKFLAAFDESIADLETSERNAEIENLAYFLSYKNFPEALANAFKKQYSGFVVDTVPSNPTVTGSFEDLIEYINDFNDAEDANAMKIAISVVVAYLNENRIPTVSTYDDIMEDITRMSQDLRVSIEAAKELSQKNANFADYSLGNQMLHDMEKNQPYTTYLANNSDKTASVSVKNDGGNRYASVNYLPEASGQYFNVTGFDSTSNFVLEFDLMVPDVENDFSSFYINATEWGISTGKRVTSRFIAFDENGQLKYITGDYSSARDDQGFPNYQEGVDDPIKLESGQWMHISIVIDVNKFEIELVIDYTSLGRKPLIVAASSGGDDDTCLFTELRFQATKGTTYCYDNLKIYTGNSYRDPDRFKNKSESELFNFYVDYAADDTNLTVNRISAYYSASGLIGSATSDAHKKLFQTISVDEILESAQSHYRTELTALVEPLRTGSITSENYSEKQSTISSIQSYIKTNQTYMDQSASWFAEINDILLEAEEQIEWVKNLMEYVEVLPLFQRAPTLTALKKHAAVAEEYYKLCMLDDPAYLAKANADKLIVDIIEELKDNYDVAAVLKDDIGQYHNIYMPDRIMTQTYMENAKKLVECVDAIELLVPDKTGLTVEQYHALILEKAQANVDYVNAYMVAMRPVVVSGEYDEDYADIEETLVIYELLDDMFYTIVQEKHYELLEEQIARYKVTNSYIERAGICTYIENYIADNNVDILSQRGALINYTVSAYKAELVTYKSEYEAILEANTKTFISLVERMQAYTEYADLKPLYQDAIDNYYYNMNVDSEAAQEAIKTFAIYEAMIQDWELNSKLFIDNAESLNTLRRPAQIYRALVNCAKYVDGVNADVEGVAEALATYSEKLAEYNTSIDAVNGEISASIDIACSVRTNVIASTVLAIIKNIFTK